MITPELLVARIVAGDRRHLARGISLVENGLGDGLLVTLHERTGRARVVGVTGSPGVGKSTLVAAMAKAYRARGLTVGVVAVDPSSPFSGGAILGDRIRMQDLFLDPGCFIRSMGSRGALGGLARRTNDVIRLLDAGGKDVILVETVGVGQGEVRVAEVADTNLVVKMPGAGDDIQMIKAGILEIADVYVMNKADRHGAQRLRAELESSLSLAPSTAGWQPPVVETVAVDGKGVDDLLSAIDRHGEYLAASGAGAERRAGRREHELRTILEDEARLAFDRDVERGGRYHDILRAVREGNLSPHAAARTLLNGKRSG